MGTSTYKASDQSYFHAQGLVGITLSSGLPSLQDSQGGQTFFIAMLYVMALGTGGIKPCVSSFGADQYNDQDPREAKQKASFFNWFYFTINIGALVRWLRLRATLQRLILDANALLQAAGRLAQDTCVAQHLSCNHTDQAHLHVRQLPS